MKNPHLIKAAIWFFGCLFICHIFAWGNESNHERIQYENSKYHIEAKTASFRDVQIVTRFNQKKNRGLFISSVISLFIAGIAYRASKTVEQEEEECTCQNT